MRGPFFTKFTVHSAYSSSCRPVYDGVSPHWKERERKIVCVWCQQCGEARRTRRSVALALAYHAHHHTRHYGTLAYRSSILPPRAECHAECRAESRAESLAECHAVPRRRRAACSPPLPSGPHQTCGSHDWMPGENSSGRAFPY